MRSIGSAHRWKRLRTVVVAVLLAGAAFSATEGLALASSSPGDQQIKAAGAAAAQAQGRTALSCPAAVAGRKAHRHFFTLAEARQCAPGAVISGDGRFDLKIADGADMTGYSRTLIVQDGSDEYEIRRLSVASGAAGDRSVLASGCPEISTWNQGRWYLDTYINNQTRWQRYWNYCLGGARAHVSYVSATCQAFIPFYCATSTASTYDDNSTDAYTDVQDNYVVCQFLCFGSTTANAWQEMTWDTRGWWNYHGWFS